MKPKEIFGLTLRFVGLMGILYVVNHLNHTWHRCGSLFVWREPVLPYEQSLVHFIFELILIAIGFYMVFGCPLFIKLIFPEKKSDSMMDRLTNKNE